MPPENTLTFTNTIPPAARMYLPEHYGARNILGKS